MSYDYASYSAPPSDVYGAIYGQGTNYEASQYPSTDTVAQYQPQQDLNATSGQYNYSYADQYNQTQGVNDYNYTSSTSTTTDYNTASATYDQYAQKPTSTYGDQASYPPSTYSYTAPAPETLPVPVPPQSTEQYQYQSSSSFVQPTVSVSGEQSTYYTTGQSYDGGQGYTSQYAQDTTYRTDYDTNQNPLVSAAGEYRDDSYSTGYYADPKAKVDSSQQASAGGFVNQVYTPSNTGFTQSPSKPANQPPSSYGMPGKTNSAEFGSQSTGGFNQYSGRGRGDYQSRGNFASNNRAPSHGGGAPGQADVSSRGGAFLNNGSGYSNKRKFPIQDRLPSHNNEFSNNGAGYSKMNDTFPSHNDGFNNPGDVNSMQDNRFSNRGDFQKFGGRGRYGNNSLRNECQGVFNQDSQRSFNSNRGKGSGGSSKFVHLSSSNYGNDRKGSGEFGRGYGNRYNKDSQPPGSFRGDTNSKLQDNTSPGYDARNRINQHKNQDTFTPSSNANWKTSISQPNSQKTPGSITADKKDEIKAPSRPQDKLLNEIKEKEKHEEKEKERKVAEEDKRKGEELAKAKAAEEARTRAQEEAKKKTEEEAKAKLVAPPSKPPETPEEFAREEEIQRKIRESVVIINPEKEQEMLKEDPVKEIEMPDELRDLLKTLTTDHFCKLCNLRMVGPQMATMHYNGKNHLKKVRAFVQTNGRSAGYNMDTLKADDATEEIKDAENKEEPEVDEKVYCKICKISFSQESQAEMHYNGKNHAKKVRSMSNNDIFECKICCVTVTAQEHLNAHLNGARHKAQIRKMESDSFHRGGLRGTGRGTGMRGRGGRGGNPGHGGGDRDNKRPGEANRGRGGSFRGQGRGEFRGRGRGRGGFDPGLKRTGDSGFMYGGPVKRPRY